MEGTINGPIGELITIGCPIGLPIGATIGMTIGNPPGGVSPGVENPGGDKDKVEMLWS